MEPEVDKKCMTKSVIAKPFPYTYSSLLFIRSFSKEWNSKKAKNILGALAALPKLR